MSEKKFLIIDSRPYGLFSIFLHTIDNIKWAEDNGYIPVVRWAPGRRDPNYGREGAQQARLLKDSSCIVDKNNFLTEETPSSFNNTPGLKHCQCLYWSESGWNGSENPWEYYFEPLNEYTVEDALSQYHDISDIFMVGELDLEIENKFLIADVCKYEPLLLWSLINNDDCEDFNQSVEFRHRKAVHDVISKHIKIKKNILNKVELFHNKHFNDNVLAVHVRGTDKKLEYPHKALPLSAYIEAIAEYVSKNPETKIYVAADNNEAIGEIMKNFRRDKLIVFPAVRMNKYFSPSPTCLTSATGPKHGEECLIETLLLSKCKHLICTDSNVAAAAMYFNPNSKITYLNRVYGA